MKITGLRLKNYRQFKNFAVDFTDPKTGEPLDKVCFIGSNGTGKSTILGILASCLKDGLQSASYHPPLEAISQIAVRLSTRQEARWIVNLSWKRPKRFVVLILKSDVENCAAWKRLWEHGFCLDGSAESQHVFSGLRHFETPLDEFELQPNGHDLAVYAPPDGTSLKAGKLPRTTVNESLGLLNNIPAFQISSFDNISEFWKFLVYQIKRRESDEKEFQKRPEVRSMTLDQAEQIFNEQHPEILTGLAEQWNLILEQAGLEFDTVSAKVPVQLSENLEAYVKSTVTDSQLTYDLLSTGIRNFLFRLGHIYVLYFNRDIRRGFLLVDEPESSLFPDLLYDIVDRYIAVTRNTQFFAATHSPIVAGQFRACERIVLQFGDDGYVTAGRGVSPEGDDPNDLLFRDFRVRSVYGKKGVEQWNRYLDLRKQIKQTDDPGVKRALLDEYNDIGNQYNFGPHEISSEAS